MARSLDGSQSVDLLDLLDHAALRPCVALIPAYNEAPAIAGVVADAWRQTLRGQRVIDEIVVIDNGSTDATADLASAAGARVVRQPERGYGAACLAGLAAAPHAASIVFIDGDASVDLNDLGRLLLPLIDGADLVIGARGRPARAAMGWPQRVGNLLASGLIRLLWRTPVSDLGPFRAVRASALARIGMSDRRFGWTVEMQVRAIQLGLRMVEVPVRLRPRVGRSKISGTLRGVLGAAHGIFGTIARLWWTGRRRVRVAPEK